MIKKIFKKWLSRYQQRNDKELTVINQDALYLLLTPLFDPVWYQKKYELDPRLSWCQLAEHYLMQGVFLDWDPSANFSSRWYWNQYPDVSAAQFNPLLHYLRHGHQEGRVASERQKQHSQRYLRVSQALWGGLSTSALEQLKLWQSSDDFRERFTAYYEQARWAYTQQKWQEYFAYSQHLSSYAQDQQQQKLAWLLGSFATYYSTQDHSAMRQYLDPFREQWQQDIDFQLALVNALCDSEQRLAALNEIYLSQGLVSISTLTYPPTLATLTSQTSSIDDGPLVTVIVPMYNSQETVDIALRSLVEQSWRRLEIIVVDDASTDDSVRKVTAWCERDSRIKLYMQPNNQGAYAARNAGLKVACGSYITIHDADDWSHPQKIELQVQALQAQPSLVATLSACVRVKKDLFITQSWRPSDRLVHYNHSSLLVCRSALTLLQGWQPVRCAADTDFIRLLESHYGKTALQTILPTIPLSLALDNAQSLTRQTDTHVRTIYFGVRHIYRQIRQLQLLLDREQPNALCLPLPEQMYTNNKLKDHFDWLIVADFTQLSLNSGDWLTVIKQAVSKEQTVALLHWPTPLTCNDNFTLDYAYALSEQGVMPIVGKRKITSKFLLVTDHELINYQIDSHPLVTNKPKVMVDKNKIDHISLKITQLFFCCES
ncbi:TPA: glycosyltransferase family 2 protein [Vibrio metschnikovii]